MESSSACIAGYSPIWNIFLVSYLAPLSPHPSSSLSILHAIVCGFVSPPLSTYCYLFTQPGPTTSNKVTAAAAATKDASCAATTWEIFDEQSKATDQGTVDDGVYGGAGSKTEVGGEETAVQRQAGELATVTLARHV